MTDEPDHHEDAAEIQIPTPDATARSMNQAAAAFQKRMLEQSNLFQDANLTSIIANIMPRGAQERISTMQQEMFRAIEPLLPKFNLSRILPRLDFGSLLPKFDIGQIVPESVLVNMRSAVLPQMGEINEAFASIFKQFEGLGKIFWPANLRELSHAEWDEALRIILYEGIPLAWIPPPGVVTALVSADTPAARRRTLVNRRRSIINSCYDLVGDAMQRGASRSDERFVLAALSALDDGHFDAAQAMATLQLDTMLNRDLGRPLRIEITNHDQGTPDLDDYPPTTALVVGAIWASHLRYKPEKGDMIPREYTRHGSVHGVSRRQYTHANAIIAVMHAVAFLRASIDHPEMIKEVRRRSSNT